MTVYPCVIHLGPLQLTGYGLMMMVAFLRAGWAIQLDLRLEEILLARDEVGGIYLSGEDGDVEAFGR